MLNHFALPILLSKPIFLHMISQGVAEKINGDCEVSNGLASMPIFICDVVAPDKPIGSAVWSRLKHFLAMNKLKKIVLRVIAKGMHEEEMITELIAAISPNESDCVMVDPEHENKVRNILKALDSNDVDLVGMHLKELAVTLNEAFSIHYDAAYCEDEATTLVQKMLNQVHVVGKGSAVPSISFAIDQDVLDAKSLVEAVVDNSSEAFIHIFGNSVNATVPIAAEVLKQKGVYALNSK